MEQINSWKALSETAVYRCHCRIVFWLVSEIQRTFAVEESII